MKRFWSKVDTIGYSPGACREWQAACNPKGYGQFSFNKTMVHAHRVAWTLTHGEIPKGMWVLHRCDNPPCCNPAHLWLGTHTDNMRDMHSKGRAPDRRGEAHPRAKLTYQQVESIRLRYADGETQTSLAAEYGVSHNTVHLMCTNQTWKNNPQPTN